jgi:hypothetical protein
VTFTEVTLNIYGVKKTDTTSVHGTIFLACYQQWKGQRISSKGQRMGFTPFFVRIRIESIPCEELA